MTTRVERIERTESGEVRISLYRGCCRRKKLISYTGSGKEWRDPRGRKAPATLSRTLSDIAWNYLRRGE